MKLNLLATLLIAASLAACSSTPLDAPAVSDATVQPVTSIAVPATSGAAPTAQSSVQSVVLNPMQETNPLSAKGVAPTARSVFFEYDSFEISPEGRAVLDAHGKYLRAHAEAQVRLEGNADERGGREYNLALGQKRADAARNALQLLGVAEKQMESVSFGKEKPVALGHDEDSWAKNRRVDVTYQAR